MIGAYDCGVSPKRKQQDVRNANQHQVSTEAQSNSAGERGELLVVSNIDISLRTSWCQAAKDRVDQRVDL